MTLPAEVEKILLNNYPDMKLEERADSGRVSGCRVGNETELSVKMWGKVSWKMILRALL